MNRFTFLKNVLGASLLPVTTLAGPVIPTPSLAAEAQRVRQELLEAWRKSEKMSLITAQQMPADSFTFKYTPEAMTFGEQWQHCCQFTVNQLAGRTGVSNPYANKDLPKNSTKEQVITELKVMYGFVRQTIETIPDAQLFASDAYMDGTIPVWRMLYALENHIIHHRGQCMVYLRLEGVIPEGYLGW